MNTDEIKKMDMHLLKQHADEQMTAILRDCKDIIHMRTICSLLDFELNIIKNETIEVSL